MAALQRPIDRWFASYSDDHRNGTNQFIHVICVPAILWSVIALLWCIPAPAAMIRPGIWAGLAMLVAALFYLKQSRRLGIGMAIVFFVLGVVTRLLYDAIGARDLAVLAAGVFGAAWIGQFVGHRIEGRKPSFLTDLTYLLIGPAWILAKLYRRLGVAY